MGNIHIRKLANIAKHTFLSKLFYILFMLIGVQLTYADEASFNFLYGPGVTSMMYSNTYNGDSSLINSATALATSSQLVVTVKGTFQSLSWEADAFNNTYVSSNKMGLTTNTIAAATDIYIAGTLIINGKAIVGSDFAFAHEHASGDWWIATNSDTEVNGRRINGTQFNVHDGLGNYYCLNQDNTNYQVRVVAGQCNGTNPYFNFSDNLKFIFLYESGIESMAYYPSYTGNLPTTGNISSLATTSQLEVNINGSLNQGMNWEAENFNSIYGPNKMGLGTLDTTADATDAYITGTLIINGNTIVGSDFAFAHEHASGDWWIATNSDTEVNGRRINGTQFNVHDGLGNYYCLNQDGTNYHVRVMAGQCSGTNPYFNFSDNLKFIFLYESGIESMAYYPSYTGNLPTTGNISSLATTSQLEVNINGSFKQGMDWEAESFNSTYSPNNKMGLGTLDTTADATDAYITGTLIINGNTIVGSDFAFAHEHTSKNWWIATNSGSITISYQFDVHDLLGNYYCLTRNANNYQVLVTTGSCSTPPPQTYQFTFTTGGGVHNLSFMPLESPESGQVLSIQTPPAGGAAVINVSAIPLNSPYIATSYNSLMTPNAACGQMVNEVYSAEVHIQGLVCGPAPQYLDFYIPGNFIIDGNYVLSRGSSTPRIFILAYGENRWWLGTVVSAFDRYTGGFMTNTNQITVHSRQGESEIEYVFKATTDSSFKVSEKGDI